MNQFVEMQEFPSVESHNQDHQINQQSAMPNHYLQLQSDVSAKNKEISFEENNSPEVQEQKIDENPSKFKLFLPSNTQVDGPQERNNVVKPKRVLVEPPKVTTISKSSTTQKLRIFNIEDQFEEQIRETIPSAAIDEPVKVAFQNEAVFHHNIQEQESQNNSFLEVNQKIDANQRTKIETIRNPEPIETKNVQIDTNQKSRFFKHSKIQVKEQKVTKGAFFEKNNVQPDEYTYAFVQSPQKKSLDSGLQVTSVHTSRDELSTRQILPPTFGSKRYKLPQLKPYKQALSEQVNQLPSQINLKQEPEPSKQVQQKIVIPWSRQIVITAREILNVPQFVRSPVPYGKRLQCELIRNKSCSSRYFLDYDLVTNDGKFLMSCKKMAFCFTSTYNISLVKGQYNQRSDFFLGKSQGNFVGSFFNIYSSNTDSFQQMEMVATIYYASSCSCCSENYREMQIYLKNDQYRYYELEGTELVKGKNLKELYEVDSNRTLKRITKYVNKKPKWIPQHEIYTLGFHGKSKMGSVKNAIIIEEGNQSNEFLLIAKKDTNQFAFDICYPFTPLVALGIIITGFDFKLATQ